MNLSFSSNFSRRRKFAIFGFIGLFFSAVLALVISQRVQETRSRAETPQQIEYKATDFIDLAGGDPQAVPGEILIKLRSSADQTIPDQVSVAIPGRESLRQLHQSVRAERFERVFERRSGILPQNQPDTAWYKVKIATSSNLPEAISRTRNQAEFAQLQALVELYKRNPDVEIAEPNYLARATLTPNDTYYSSRNFFVGYDDMYWTRKINLPSAWDQTTGNNILVAVIDSGVDRWHPDISSNMSSGYDFANNDSDPNDDHGHGTHVAGILGAYGNNNQQVVGVNWRVKIMPIKVLDRTGWGTFDNIARGLRYAADRGAKVANLSISGDGYSQIMEDSVTYAYNRGVTVVVAAGNNNVDATLNSPANTTNSIAVGATDPYDQKAAFSAFGSKIDVVAPGVDILSIASNASPMCGISTGGYNYVCRGNGTSYSAPQVAGLAALMLSKKSSLTPQNIRQILRSSARDLGSTGQDSSFGYGMIDAGKAMAQVAGTTISNPPPPSTPPSQPTVPPSQPSTPTSSTSPVPVYRLYNGIEHFFTTNTAERDSLLSQGYVSEGVGFNAFTSQVSRSSPVYRLYNVGTEHFYTANLTERNSLIAGGYKDEGIAFYAYKSNETGSIPVYRLYNGNVHHFTTSLSEVTSSGFRYEGIGFYAK